MKRYKLFLDSDVIISSLISKKGAAYQLLSYQNKLQFYISDYSRLELQRVCQRMNLSQIILKKVCSKCRLKKLKAELSIVNIKSKFKAYTQDINDCHIVAGAVKTKSKFLITYNLKHYKRQELIEDFDLVTLSPALFLQYLRSQESA